MSHPFHAWLDKSHFGLELGPSHRPVAAKRNGYNVRVLDHLNREQLIAKYEQHGVDLNAIEEVDYVWNGEPYRQLVGDGVYFDWIVASHLIEHTPDMISFLLDCAEIVTDDGFVALTVPDKRYCFDRYRPRTSLASIIDAHQSNRKIHSVGTAAEYFLNVVSRGGHIAWDPTHDGQYAFVHTSEEARNAMQVIAEQGAYLDLHAWVFTPSSFRLVIEDLYILGLSPFRESSFKNTTGHEFHIQLSRSGNGPGLSRYELLKQIDAEEEAVLNGPLTSSSCA